MDGKVLRRRFTVGIVLLHLVHLKRNKAQYTPVDERKSSDPVPLTVAGTKLEREAGIAREIESPENRSLSQLVASILMYRYMTCATVGVRNSNVL